MTETHRPAATPAEDEPDLLRDQFRQLTRYRKLIGAGMLVGIAGVAYAEFTGETFAIGPVQPLFIAGPLVIAGVLIALVRFFQQAK